jgi:RimJ/RimL family protein N-acetyltransferase
VILSSTELKGGELVLRPLERGDRDAIYAAVVESIAQLSPWLPWCHTGYTVSETESFIELCITAWAQQAHFPFAIFDAQSGQYFGGTGINHIDRQNRLGSIGYWVRSGATGRGIAPQLDTIARIRIVQNGRPYDAALYSLIPSDLAAAPAS